MEYAPAPTEEQLDRVRQAIGSTSLMHVRRMTGGLGCTMDLLGDSSSRLVLRRYGQWTRDQEIDVAERETRALELMQRANIPAPAPIWVDNDGIFEERAIIISFIDGAPDLSPSNPFEWAEELASTLNRIHGVRPREEDLDLFPYGAGEDTRKITENPELVLAHPLGEDLLRRRIRLAEWGAESEHVFSHTDFWPGNTLWSDGRLAAVIDWETPSMGDREMDVAYCSLDIRYLGMDRVADHFVQAYREASGSTLPNLAHWESIALCRPLPDIAAWVPAWVAMGRSLAEDDARTRYTEVLEAFLDRTG